MAIDWEASDPLATGSPTARSPPMQSSLTSSSFHLCHPTLLPKRPDLMSKSRRSLRNL